MAGFFKTLSTLIKSGRITTGVPGAPNGLGPPGDVVEAERTGPSVHLGSHPKYTASINSLLDGALLGVRNPAAPTAAELDLLTTRLRKIVAFTVMRLAGLDPTAIARR